MSDWNYEVFWDEVLKQFKEELSDATFSMWFNMDYEYSTENSIVLSVPSKFFETQINKRYKDKIEKKLKDLSGRALIIEFVVKAKELNDNEEEKEVSEQKSPKNKKKAEKKQKTQETKNREQHPDLNKDYNFDDFIVGPNNNFAVNAALAVVKNPGTAYNPFLIYGGVGLGKTHLMQASGNALHDSNDLKIIYVTAEKFTNEFVESLRVKGMRDFKNKYRSCDVLLIDDIHFFEKKDGTQEELFHTFNELYEKNKQIIFTCDRPPSELKNLTQRLKSRFERGLNVDLQTPGFETRKAILLKKLEKKNVRIPDEVLDMVAKNISSNVRDLEAALTKLIAYTEITKKEINLNSAKDLLRDVFGSTRQRNVTVDLIQKCVAEHFKISISDIKGKKRTKSIAFPRHIAMYLCREMTECSTTELGNEFGGRDHTTIIHGYNKIVDQITAEPTLESNIHELQKMIKEATNK